MDIENIIRKIIASELERFKESLINNSQKPIPQKITEVEYLSKKMAAKLISVSVSTIEAYIKEKSLTRYYVRGKNSVRFKRNEVLALMKKTRTTEAKPQPKRRTKRGLNRL